MTIQLNEIKECFGDANNGSRKIARNATSADEAYERLRIVRKFYDEFGDAINKHVRTIPEITRSNYEGIFQALDELIEEECYNVRNGD